MNKLVKERGKFFADLSVHDEMTILERFTSATPDEIHGTPNSPQLGETHRPPHQGGLVHELKRRLIIRNQQAADKRLP